MLSPSDIGKLIHVAFGSDSSVDRKSVRVQGGRSYMYCGIRRKREDTSTTKRPRLSPTTEQTPWPDLEAELKHERQLRKDSEGRVQHERQIGLDLELQLQHERQIRNDFELHLQHERQIRQDLEFQLQHERQVRQNLEKQIQTIPWDRVRAELDTELVSLQRTGGVLSTGPIDTEDPGSLTEFSFSQLHDQLLQHAPNITFLLSTIGSSGDVTKTVTTPKDIHSLAAISVLAKKNSDNVKGFQLLLSLMLVARATSKLVITTLNHIGICLSYSQTLRYIENAARTIENSRELSHGHWIVAYDNINIQKRMRHERFARHTEAWNFTSRLALKVAKLPPPEYNSTAGISQCKRTDLSVEDILPSDDDDRAFHESAQRRVERMLVKRFKCCSHLTATSNYCSLGQEAMKSVIHPIAVIDIDESYTDNNVTILDEFQKILAVNDSVQQCVVGDQATCRAIRGARRRRVADVPHARLLWAKENPGDFHFTWECLKVIYLTFWESPEHPGSLAHFSKLTNRSNVTIAAKKFQQADEFLRHALEAHLTASLLTFLNVSSTSAELACEETTLTDQWLLQTAERFANQVLTVPTDEDAADADHMYNFHRSFLQMALLYEDLRDAIKHEDGPRIIQHWRMWLLYFLASKRTNYSSEAANLLANLKADFSKWLAYVVTHNRTVNSSGRPGHGKAIDMAVEHHNLVIKTAIRSSSGNITLHHLKVISLASQMLHDAAVLCDEEVLGAHTGAQHQTTTAERDIQMMTSSLIDSQATCRISERKLPSSKSFTTPERKGYNIALSKQWLANFLKKEELRLDEETSTDEDHEEIDFLEDISM